MEFGAGDCLFPWNVDAETGGIGGPSLGGLSGEEGSAPDFARGEVRVCAWTSSIGVGEKVGGGMGEVVGGGTVVLVDFVVGEVGPSEVVG